MNVPLVSLILLSYDYERYVGDAIRSVLAQTCPEWELIVVDDASTDGSLEVIRSFADPRLRVLSLATNQGASATYNRAYALCRGTYVGSVDADDFLDPRRLERQIEVLASHPEVDVLGTYVREVDAAGRAIPGEVEAWFNQARDLDDVKSWLMRNHLCHSSVLLRRAAHDRVGLLNPELRAAADYELWLRALARGVRFRVLREPLTFSRQHGANVWTRLPRSRIFLELAYVLSAHLGRHLLAAGRTDLFGKAAREFADHFLPHGTAEERFTVMAELLSFPIHPRDFTGFAAAFRQRCAPHWEAILAAVARNGTAP